MEHPWIAPRTAYLHVPFCANHCGYCDFAVTAGQDHLIELYLDALIAEISTLQKPQMVESLFIGGGTPTYLSADQLQRLLEAVHQWLPLVDAEPEGPNPPIPFEFSIESTPESLDDDKVKVLARYGVNRVSIGVQSFQPELLKALDRKHSPDDIPRAVETVRKRIAAVSFDLIFAAPGSTLDTWKADLDRALELDPNHISTYGLTYEKGTPLWKEREKGVVRPIDEEAELKMYSHAIDRLTGAGFRHYEISNFARRGFQCRHNMRYWANEAYFGFGVGAARYINGRRELNVRDTKMYLKKVLSHESPTFQSECLEPLDRAFETIGTQLRRHEGIDRYRFEDQTGFDLTELVGDRLENLMMRGQVDDDGRHVALTRQGKYLADAIIEDLMKANTGEPGGGARPSPDAPASAGRVFPKPRESSR
jgi:oxygen-independent coproporphyrinogen-3 oxidase